MGVRLGRGAGERAESDSDDRHATTMSFGVSFAPAGTPFDYTRVFDEADSASLRAKRDGRGRVLAGPLLVMHGTGAGRLLASAGCLSSVVGSAAPQTIAGSADTGPAAIRNTVPAGAVCAV